MKIGAAAAAILAVMLTAPAASAQTLGVGGPSILLDGRPAFLTGVSLFDALGAAAPRDSDLDALKQWGVNAVRVWAHWHEPIYQADGALTATGRARLLALAQRLQARGLVFELVLLRPGQLPGQPFALFASEAARAKAVDAVTEALRPFRNVLFDLYNEHDHPDGPISHAAARLLRDRVKAIDEARIVTLSSTEYHLISAAGEIGPDAARNLQEEAGRGAGSVGVDVLAPHFPRTENWADSTAARIRAVRAALDQIGSRVPIYLNEEQRAGPRTRVPADVYRRAWSAAQSAAASGWVFHTAAGFELGTTPFLDMLSPDERAALGSLRTR